MPQLSQVFQRIISRFSSRDPSNYELASGETSNSEYVGQAIDENFDRQSPALQGLSLLYLLTDTSSWVHRRIESIRLSEQGTTRRHVSQDVTLPKQGKVNADSRGRVVIPLGWMLKGPVSRLDATYEAGPLVVLGKKEHADYIVHMLVSAFEILCDSRKLLAEDRQILEDVLNAETKEDSSESLKSFRELMNELVPPENAVTSQRESLKTIETMVELLATHYIFLVEAHEDLIGVRSTLKFSLDLSGVETSDVAPIELYWNVPDFQFAASQHFEVQVPKNLMIKRLRFIAFDKHDEASQVEDVLPSTETRTAHVVLRPQEQDVTGGVVVSVQPSRQGLYSFTWWSVFLTAILVAGSAIVRKFDTHILATIDIPSSSASIVLIAPAVLMSWVSREQEHTLVSLLLRPLRRILIMTAALLVSIACLAAVPLTSGAWNTTWVIIYVFTIALVIYAVLVFRGYRKHLV